MLRCSRYPSAQQCLTVGIGEAIFIRGEFSTSIIHKQCSKIGRIDGINGIGGVVGIDKIESIECN
ncbi:uncharacterized protein LOC143218028 isoform X3 [Lasioglossum baleicum]|uniref:uncharacterized protein LOC143218028 isoform X3 n=1 Tax=Lasioglossum baleicum TaxID=434251 RepID=UPI003FCDB6A0